MAASKWLPSIECASQYEALVVLIGLQLVLDASFSNVEVETDNMQVANALQNSTSLLFDVGLILDDIQALSANLNIFSFNYYHREAN